MSPRLLAFAAAAALWTGCATTPAPGGPPAGWAARPAADAPARPPAPDAETPDDARAELRGVWLTNVDSDVLLTREGIEEAMAFLAAHRFNVVYPVMYNAGHTLYPSAVMAAVTGETIDPRYAGRDPLAELIDAARRHGIAVIPWFEYGFASVYDQPDGGAIVRARPHWAERDRAGRLLAKNKFYWLNPYHPEVQAFVKGLVMEVVTGYDVDGVQGDDRLPANPSTGGYSEHTRALYAAEHDGAEPPAEPLDPAWLRWRADRLNAFARDLYQSVKAVRPDAVVSWAPSIFPWGYENYLQDWPSWLGGGYADQIIPQNYRYDLERYTETLATQRTEYLGLDPALNAHVYPGVLMNVGDYTIPVDYLLGLMAHHRARGYRGEVFFFYEGLRRNDDQLARALSTTFYREPAPVPFRRAAGR